MIHELLPNMIKVIKILRARRMIRLPPERYDLNRPLVWKKGIKDDKNLFSIFEPTRHSSPYKTVIANALESLDFLESLQSAFHHRVGWSHSPDVWAFASICTVETKTKKHQGLEHPHRLLTMF